MLFLGQAANYSAPAMWRQLFVHGNRRDMEALAQALAERYLPKKLLEQGFSTEKSTQREGNRVVLYQSGRSALAAAIMATVPRGSAVIITGLTCIAVVRAVKAAGCVPVFADIDRETLQFNAETVKKALDKCRHKDYNVRGIVVQNTLGRLLEVSAIEEIAKEHDLVIIEDLAHSAGRFYDDGREVGTVGAATILSFGKGKAIDTITGGAVIIRAEKPLVFPRPPQRRARLGARLRARIYPLLGKIIRGGYYLRINKIITAVCLKIHLIERSADVELNLDLKLEPWQAKLALEQLRKLPKMPLREGFLVRKRERLLAEMRKRGYHLDEIWYDVPVSPARYAKEANFSSEDCPETVRVAQEIVNLPTYYSEQKLAPVRKMIAKYEINNKDIVKSCNESMDGARANDEREGAK